MRRYASSTLPGDASAAGMMASPPKVRDLRHQGRSPNTLWDLRSAVTQLTLLPFSTGHAFQP